MAGGRIRALPAGAGALPRLPPEVMEMHDLTALVDAILRGYALRPEGTHGLRHWGRVWETGLRLAEATGADRDVVSLFALFHDARRRNEGTDHGHGRRGALLAESLRGSLVQLEEDRFALLSEACWGHTDGRTDGDLTVQVCWDADRLDLGRVWTTPDPRRLCTDAARELLAWANERAVREAEPVQAWDAWGVDPLSWKKRRSW